MTSIAMKPRGDYMSNDNVEPEEILKSLQNQMVKCLNQPLVAKNLQALMAKAEIMEDIYDLHFRDDFGYTLLGNAVKLHAMDAIKFLVEKKKFVVKEEMIIAVDIDYRDCIEYFLKHDPELINRPVLAGTVCRPGTSPVMMASLKQNESMLKFLFARGAQPLNIPTYNPRETSNIIRFDAIYQTMVALSNPIYLCIMNEDPLMVSFKISERCQQISEDLHVVAKDVLSVKNRCEKFSADFISSVATFDDLQLILDQMTTEDSSIVAPGKPWERLRYALNHEHVEFVAKGSIQKLIKRKFYSGPVALQDIESANFVTKLLFFLALICSTPIWMFLFMFIPKSDTPTGKFITGWIEMPLMRYVVQNVTYAVLLLLAVSASIQLDKFPLQELQQVLDDRLCFEHLVNNRTQCLNENPRYASKLDEYESNITLFEMDWQEKSRTIVDTVEQTAGGLYFVDTLIFLWVIGNVVKEVGVIWADGFKAYTSDWVNSLNILLNFSFLFSLIVRYTHLFASGDSEVTKDFFNPLALSDSFRALGLLFLIFKMYKALRITAHVGSPQLLLGEAFNASFNFFITFLCTFTAFSVSINGMLHRTYFQYWLNCEEGNATDVNIPCSTRSYVKSFEEMDRYQNFGKLYLDFFFAMFQSDTALQFNFFYYQNFQEIIATLMYAIYAFVMIIVRLNILISLIIFAILEACNLEEQIFKFRRTALFFMYICDESPIPPPLNILPSIYRITAWYQNRRIPESEDFTEDDLRDCENVRKLMRQLKGTYLREQRKQERGNSMCGSEVEAMKNEIWANCDDLKKGVQDIQVNTEELIMQKNKKKRGVSAKDDIGDVINNNKYMQKYSNNKPLF